MRSLITFCVLLLFSTLSESIPFLPEYQKEYPKEIQPPSANTYSNVAQPQILRYDELGSVKTGTAYERPLPSSPGLITRENLSQPPAMLGRTVEEIRKTLQDQRPFINERIDYKIQPPYTPVQQEIKLNTVPTPYVPQIYPHVVNINNIRNTDSFRHLPQNTAPDMYAPSITIEEQRERAAEVSAIKETEVAQANARVAALIAKEEQIASALTKPNLKETNVYTPPKQYQYANLPPNYHQIRHIMQSNPKLTEVITSVKNKKRYLVVHPDGRVEHVDNLEPIIQKHPEHIMVNADILRNHVSSINPLIYPAGTSVPNPPSVPIPVTLNSAPRLATAAAPTLATSTGPTATATAIASTGPVGNPVLKPSILPQPANTAPTTSITAANVIKTPVTLTPTKITITPTSQKAVTTAPLLIPTAVVPSATPIPTTSSVPGVPKPPTAEPAHTVSNSPVLSTIDKTANNVHAAHTTAETKPVVHPSAVSKPTPSSNIHVNTLSSPIPPTITSKTSNTPTTTLKSSDIPTTTSKVLDTLTTTLQTSDVPTTKSKASDTPTTTSEALDNSFLSTSSSLNSTPYEKTPLVDVNLKSIPTKAATNSQSTATSDIESSSSEINLDSSTSTSSNATISNIVADSTNADEPCSTTMDKNLIAVESYATAGMFDEVLSEDLDDIPGVEKDDSQSASEPVVWFEATDSDFWDQLLEDESCNIIYFFNVPPQPIIEKDTKTKIFPNGTMIEEITETKRSKECAEPIVTKSVRLIEPEE